MNSREVGFLRVTLLMKRKALLKPVEVRFCICGAGDGARTRDNLLGRHDPYSAFPLASKLSGRKADRYPQ